MNKILRIFGIGLVTLVVSCIVLFLLAGVFAYFAFKPRPGEETAVLSKTYLCGDIIYVEGTRVNDNPFESGPETYVALFYSANGEKRYFGEIGNLSRGSYDPLAKNTYIPVYDFGFPATVEPDDKSSLTTISIDPNTFTRTEFDAIGQCLQKENGKLSTIIAATKPLYGSLEGIEYTTYNEKEKLIKQLVPDPEFFYGNESVVYVNKLGVILFGKSYAGNIFTGLAHEADWYGEKMFEAKNRSGERFDTFLKRVLHK